MKVLKRNVRAYWITQFNHALVFTIPIWIVYYQGFLNPVQISIIVAFQYILQLVMELPSGAFADLLGRKFSLHIAYLLLGVSFILFPFAREFWQFLALAALVGMSDSFRSGSEEALLFDSFKEAGSEDFDVAYSKGNLIYQSGLIIGTLAGGFLYEVYFGLPFILTGISALIGFAVTFVYTEPALDSEKFSFTNYLKQIKQGSKEAFKDKLTTYTSLYYIAVGGITWTNALYFGSYFIVGLGFEDTQRGLIQGSVRLANALLITYLLTKVKLSDKFKILFFPVAMLVGFLPGAFVGGWLGVAIYQVALIAGTCRWIFLTPMTNKVFTSKVRATAISVLSLLIGFIYIAIVGISGFVIDSFDIGTMYSLLGILSLITVVPLAIKLLIVKSHLS